MTSELTVAIHAAVYLAHKNAPQSSDELAVNICTHPVRVRKIMAYAGPGSRYRRKAARAAIVCAAPRRPSRCVRLPKR